jgi:hypothetical protein
VRAAEQLEVLVAGQPRVHEGLLWAVAEPTGAGDGAGVGGERPDQDLHQG